MRAHHQNGEEEFKYWLDLIHQKQERAKKVLKTTSLENGKRMLEGYLAALNELEKAGTYGIPEK